MYDHRGEYDTVEEIAREYRCDMCGDWWDRCGCCRRCLDETGWLQRCFCEPDEQPADQEA